MRATPTELPAGVCGQVEGVAMVYGVIDSWGTSFVKGCMDRTIRERVAAKKVKLYFDHGDVVLSGMYDTHLHIGTVTDVYDSTTDDGLPCSRFRADLFDTETGRTAHEYLRAIAATGSETGVSIGMMDEPKMVRATVAGQQCDQVTELALREISVTGESSVPGTKVTGVRQEIIAAKEAASAPVAEPIAPLLLAPPNYFALLDGIVAHLGADAVRAHLGTTLGSGGDTDNDAASGAPDSTASDAVTPTSPGVSHGGTEPPVPNVVPMQERVAFLRSTYAEGYSP
jgi:phage head maturation protease